MTTIDKRVVEMQFNNDQFKRGIQGSLDSIKQLNKGLEFKDSSNGLKNLVSMFNAFTVGKISTDVDRLRSTFSGFGIAGMRVMTRLTDAAINWGKQIINSVTGIAAAKSGLQEYETQINAIQTILANTSTKGTTLDQVNAALAELNTYADKTIYNFTEMTRNIGTFTAAGTDLDTSVNAIKGIANLAAVSGSNSQQASTAMYQLSQAISSGIVRLQDWNSVTNAGMGGEIFQEALKDTARVHGIAIDEMIEKEGGFRTSLDQNWLTSQVLLETLTKFTGDLNEEQLLAIGYTAEETKEIIKLGAMANDAATKVKTFTQLKDTLKEMAQSGWTKTWELIIGDFGQAKELWTSLSNYLGGFIDASSKARNDLLQSWNDLGGRFALINTVSMSFKKLLEVLAPIKEAFQEVFPPMTGEQLYKLTIGLKVFVKNIKITDEMLAKIKSVFKGVFSVFDILRQGVIALFQAFGKLTQLPSLSSFPGKLLDMAAGAGDFLTNLSATITETDAFGKAFVKMGEFLAKAKSKFLEFIATMKEVYANVSIFVATLKEKFSPISNIVKEIFQPFKDSVGDSFDNFKDMDGKGIKAFVDRIKARFAPLATIPATIGGIIDKIKSAIFSKLPESLDITKEASGNAGKFVSTILDALSEGLPEMIANFDFNTITDLFTGGLTAALVLSIKNFLSNISAPFKDLGKGLGGLLGSVGSPFKSAAGVLDEVKDSLGVWQSTLKADILQKIAISVGILAVAIIALSLIDSVKLATATGAITVMFADLLASMAMFDKMTGKQGVGSLLKVVVPLIAMSVAVLILSSAVKKLADLEWDELIKGVSGVVAISATLIATAKLLSKNSGSMIKGGIALIGFALALQLIVISMKDLAKLEVEDLQQSLLAIALIFAGIALFIKTSGGQKELTITSIAIGLLGLAMNVFAMAVERLGNIDADKIQQGLIALGVVLAELAIFTRAVGSPKKMISTAVGLTALSGALYLMSYSIEKLGKLSKSEMEVGLVGLAGGLGILILALNGMPKDMVLKSTMLIALSTALILLAEALTRIGGMTWDEVARGLVALAGSLVILAGGLYLMSGAIAGAAALFIASAALLALAPALKLMGSMNIQEIGLALLMLVGVFAVLGVAGLVMAPLIPVLLGLGAAFVLFGLGALAFGAGIGVVATGIAALAVAGAAGITTFTLLVKSMVELIPLVVTKVAEGILDMVRVIIDAIPELAAGLTTLLRSLIQVFLDIIPETVDAIITLVTALVEGLLSLTPMIVDAGFELMLSLLTAIRDNIKEITIVAFDIVIAFIEAITEKLPELADAGFEMIITFIDSLTESVEENIPRLMESVADLGIAVVDGLIDGLGRDSVVRVIAKINKIGEAILTTLKNILGIHSPSTEAYDITRYVGAGLVNGLVSMLPKITDSAKTVGNRVLDSLTDAVSKATDILTMDVDMTPRITPVLDLSDVISGSRAIDGLLGKDISLNLSSSAKKASTVTTPTNGNDISSTPSEIKETVTYVQNITSPKALSRYEIYRNTKNLLKLRPKGGF
jgi:tape measure domain-containing protein